jgi:hypothetical protein
MPRMREENKMTTDMTHSYNMEDELYNSDGLFDAEDDFYDIDFWEDEDNVEDEDNDPFVDGRVNLYSDDLEENL